VRLSPLNISVHLFVVDSYFICFQAHDRVRNHFDFNLLRLVGAGLFVGGPAAANRGLIFLIVLILYFYTFKLLRVKPFSPSIFT